MGKSLSAGSTESETKNEKAGDTSNSRTFQPKDLNDIRLKLRILQHAIHEYQKAGGSAYLMTLDGPKGLGVFLPEVEIVGSELVLVGNLAEVTK
jgi:hypothetical protein